MSVKMKFGSKDIPFVYKGDKLVYPNPIRDGLLLWYDFKGMRNADTNKEVVKDLSGNGNDGTLVNFNFTEESGYKDNTLVFDGVDDKLIVPELMLDETAMSVMHDGKLYAYEDDKVLTIGEDGEIVSSGKNLLLSSDIPQSSSEYILANYTYSEQLVLDEPFTVTAKVKLGEGAQYPRFYNTGGHVTGALGVPSKIQEFPDGTTIWKLTGTWKIATAGNDFLRLYQVVSGDTYPVSTVEWCKLERGTTETPYVSSSSDYKTTEITLPNITDLQLYNKTLHKDELLHNAESKGLKKLKDGVVVQDGLVLHYDFSHESNTSEYKDKAFDYSGNGNHGELKNFNFTEESGYAEDGLKFDGVDDYVGESVSRIVSLDSYQETISFVAKVNENKRNNILYAQENLKIDIRGNSLSRADVTPSISLSYDFLDKIVSVIMVKTETNVKTFINGKLFGDASITNSSSTQLSSIGYYIPNGRPNINLYDVKIYNRTLTPEEIAHNYQIEKEKYNIVEGDA